jgi:hypothetical protein
MGYTEYWYTSPMFLFGGLEVTDSHITLQKSPHTHYHYTAFVPICLNVVCVFYLHGHSLVATCFWRVTTRYHHLRLDTALPCGDARSEIPWSFQSVMLVRDRHVIDRCPRYY